VKADEDIFTYERGAEKKEECSQRKTSIIGQLARGRGRSPLRRKMRRRG